MMKPEVAAKASNYIQYPNGNLASQQFIDKEILEDKSTFPDQETMANLFIILPLDQKTQREETRLWRDVKRK
jgi:putrescine transport system substrate-binding protein